MASRIPFEHPLRHPHPQPLLLWPEQRKDTNSKPSTSLVFDPRIELRAAKNLLCTMLPGVSGKTLPKPTCTREFQLNSIFYQQLLIPFKL